MGLERVQHTKLVAALTLSPLVDIGVPDKRRATTLKAVTISKKSFMLEPLCESWTATWDLPTNTSGIKAMQVSITSDAVIFHRASRRFLELCGQPLTAIALLCHCPSAFSWPSLVVGKLNGPASESTGSNSVRDVSSFSEMVWVPFGRFSISERILWK